MSLCLSPVIVVFVSSRLPTIHLSPDTLIVSSPKKIHSEVFNLVKGIVGAGVLALPGKIRHPHTIAA